jgi:hypothetical protein
MLSGVISVTSASIVPDASFVIPVLMSSNGVTLTVTPYCLPNAFISAGSMYAG